jgi:hypothetical protein
MLYEEGVLQIPASEDIDLDADQVYDACNGHISPPTCQSAVFGRYNDVILNVRQFVIILYFPFLDLHRFSFRVGSWIWDLSFQFTVLFSHCDCWFAPLGYESLLRDPMVVMSKVLS